MTKRPITDDERHAIEKILERHRFEATRLKQRVAFIETGIAAIQRVLDEGQAEDPDTGTAGDECCAGNECGRIGCERCQQ